MIPLLEMEASSSCLIFPLEGLRSLVQIIGRIPLETLPPEAFQIAHPRCLSLAPINVKEQTKEYTTPKATISIRPFVPRSWNLPFGRHFVTFTIEFQRQKRLGVKVVEWRRESRRERRASEWTPDTRPSKAIMVRRLRSPEPPAPAGGSRFGLPRRL
uniref:Uncharacterized protein n=1 Tax=Steinernema glaseri TaxID=37863 RepID=A0A1I7YGV0_9BILA